MLTRMIRLLTILLAVVFAGSAASTAAADRPTHVAGAAPTASMYDRLYCIKHPVRCADVVKEEAEEKVGGAKDSADEVFDAVAPDSVSDVKDKVEDGVVDMTHEVASDVASCSHGLRKCQEVAIENVTAIKDGAADAKDKAVGTAKSAGAAAAKCAKAAVACAGNVIKKTKDTLCTANPVCAIAGMILDAAKAAADAILTTIAEGFGSAAFGFLSWLWGGIDATTSVDLSEPAVRKPLVMTWAIAAIITLFLFLFQVCRSALLQDPGGMGRAVRGLAVSGVGAPFAIAATTLLLAAVDQLCKGVVDIVGASSTRALGEKLFAASLFGSGSQLGSIGLIMASVGLIISTVIVWCSLLIRKILIVIDAVFAPVAFSGAASDVSNGWVRNWIEFTVALVSSKLILVLIMAIGFVMFSGADSIDAFAAGAVILLMAGFAPFAAMKLVHFAGNSLQNGRLQTAGAGVGAVGSAPGKLYRGANQLQGTKSMLSGMGRKKDPSAGSSSSIPHGRGGSLTGPKTPAPPTPAPAGAGGSAGGAAAAGGVAGAAVAAAVAVAKVPGKVGKAAGRAAGEAPGAATPGGDGPLPRPPSAATSGGGGVGAGRVGGPAKAAQERPDFHQSGRPQDQGGARTPPPDDGGVGGGRPVKR